MVLVQSGRQSHCIPYSPRTSKTLPVYFERCEISFGVTELRLGIQVDCWEVPSPPVEFRAAEAEAWALADDTAQDE